MDGGLVKALKGSVANKLPALLVGEPWLRANQVYRGPFHFHHDSNRKPLGVLRWHLPTGLSQVR